MVTQSSLPFRNLSRNLEVLVYVTDILGHAKGNFGS